MTNRPVHPPFAQQFPVLCADDVRRLEQTPLAEAVPVQSTYEIFANSAAAFGDRPALTFLRTATPHPGPDEQPITWRFADLLAGIHRFANALHRLGFGPTDTVAVLMPGSLPYHLALWGGSAAGIVQPLNPLLSIDKLCSLLKASGATVLVAWGAEDDSGYWSKAMALREQVPRRYPNLDTPDYSSIIERGARSFFNDLVFPGYENFTPAVVSDRGHVVDDNHRPLAHVQVTLRSRSACSTRFCCPSPSSPPGALHRWPRAC